MDQALMLLKSMNVCHSSIQDPSVLRLKLQVKFVTLYHTK